MIRIRGDGHERMPASREEKLDPFAWLDAAWSAPAFQLIMRMTPTGAMPWVRNTVRRTDFPSVRTVKKPVPVPLTHPISPIHDSREAISNVGCVCFHQITTTAPGNSAGYPSETGALSPGEASPSHWFWEHLVKPTQPDIVSGRAWLAMNAGNREMINI